MEGVVGLAPRFLIAGSTQDSDSPAIQLLLGLGFALTGVLLGLFPEKFLALYGRRGRRLGLAVGADRKGVGRFYYWLSVKGTAVVFVAAGAVMVVFGISRLVTR